MCCIFFFVSSRRRHTRFDCDWSSDVCSSDLMAEWARRYPFLRRTELADPQSGLVAKLINDATGYLSSSLLPYLRAGGKLFIAGVSVLVMATYLARTPGLYSDGVVSLVPPRHRGAAIRILDDTGPTLRPASAGQ